MLGNILLVYEIFAVIRFDVQMLMAMGKRHMPFVDLLILWINDQFRRIDLTIGVLGWLVVYHEYEYFLNAVPLVSRCPNFVFVVSFHFFRQLQHGM